MSEVSRVVGLAGRWIEVQAGSARVAPWVERIVSSLPAYSRALADEAAAASDDAAALRMPAPRPPTAVVMRVEDPNTVPPPPVLAGERAALFHYDTYLYPRPAGAWVLARAQGGGAVVDVVESHVQVWIPDGPIDAAEDWFSVTVMVALALALRAQDRFHVHAALVMAPDGRWWGIAGESGSGKTTLTLALVAASGAWASDDALFVAAAHPGVAWGWPRLFHVSPNTLAMFPHVRPAAAEAAPTLAGKFRVDVGQGANTMVAVPLAGWLFPHVSSQPRSTAAPLSGAGGFGRLLTASAWAAFPELVGQAEHLAALRTAANLGAAWEVALGQEMLLDPSSVARLVAGLPA